MNSIFGVFKKKKKEKTVSNKLEETMNKTLSPMPRQGSFFTTNDVENTMSDLDGLETMSAHGGSSRADEKFVNIMEVLNNPNKQTDLLQSMNEFFASNFASLSNVVQARKLHSTVSKSISTESFSGYIQKIGRVGDCNQINSMIQKNQEQDRRDREQFELVFQKSEFS